MANRFNNIFRKTILKLHKKQAIYEILSSFEDMCSLVLMGSILNPFALKQVIDQMDALNMALIWINQLCSDNDGEIIQYDISETEYAHCCDFLNHYAYPYSVVCSGYIAHSQGRFDATIDGNCVTFDLNSKQNNSSSSIPPKRFLSTAAVCSSGWIRSKNCWTMT